MYKVRTLFSYVLSVNVRTLKIIINLIKHKNAYKQTKAKKRYFYAHKNHLKGKKSLIRLFAFLYFLCFLVLLVLLVLFVALNSFCPFCAFCARKILS